MKSNFDKLVTVYWEHVYYNTRPFTGLAAAVSRNTSRVLNNIGLLYKSQPNGFTILYETQFAGTQRTKASLLRDTVTLEFYLTLTDPHFYNYTQLVPGDITRSVFYFHNSSDGTENTSKALLHTGELVAEKDLAPVEKLGMVFFKKPFAVLRLQLNTQAAGEYYIRFPAKSTYWNYILMSDHLKNLDRPAVIDTQAKEIFDGPGHITLPGNRNALSFISQQPIALTDTVKKRFQLVEEFEPATGKYKIVQSALPLPGITVISSAMQSREEMNNKEFSEIFIY